MTNKLFIFLEWISTIALIGAYLLMVLDIISSERLTYLFMNLFASSIMAFVILRKKLYGYLVVQIFWSGISLLGIVKYFNLL